MQHLSVLAILRRPKLGSDNKTSVIPFSIINVSAVRTMTFVSATTQPPSRRVCAHGMVTTKPAPNLCNRSKTVQPQVSSILELSVSFVLKYIP